MTVYADPNWPTPQDTGPVIDPRIGLQVAAEANAAQAERLHKPPTTFLHDRAGKP